MREETIDRIDLDYDSDRFSLDFKALARKIDYLAVIVILACTGVLFIAAVKFGVLRFWTEFLQSTPFLRAATYPLAISALMVLGGTIFQTILWLHYRPQTLKPRERVEWPSVSVIMCAYNEEELIGQAIDSVFTSDYPRTKLELICVDDGSRDGTFLCLRKAKRKYGERLKVVTFRGNQGKRKAFYAAFKRSKGEAIVTVDADGRIDRAAIRNLMIPLIKDKETGVVGGRVAVLNDKENLLTRMLAVRYALAFDFGRGYQSVYGGVVSCPGALTAYRRELVKRVIREWMNQTFMGVRCRAGEDRALTTMALRAGYMVRYQSNALVFTQAPARVGQMNRMYLRWSRSYIRESTIFARFMFRPYRRKHRVLPVVDFILTNALHPVHLFSLGVVLYSFAWNPMYIARHFGLLSAGALLLSLYYLRSRKSWDFVYGVPYAVLSFFLLWWIIPYSVITVRNQSWMTR